MTENTKPIEPVKNPTVEMFKILFPAFAETSTISIGLYLKIACKRIADKALGSDTEYGRMLLAAHMLTVNGANVAEGETSTVGSFSGAIASKTVGSMSVSYDTGGTAETGAGWYNLTNYGKQLYSLMRQHRRMPMVVMGRALEP